MKSLANYILLFTLTLLMSSCYYQKQRRDAWDVNDTLPDSLEFVYQHHYTIGYNFVVQRDSLPLCTEIPSRAQQLAYMPDSLVLYKNDLLVVAQIETVPEDSLDSVWIKVAHDQSTQGWVRESELLPSVSPNDLISQGIYFFSGNHVWGTILFTVLLLCIFGVQFLWARYRQQKCGGSLHFVYPRLDLVCSPYPLFLLLTMGFSAVFYSSMQLFAAHTWTEFYFHPTFNPFAVPALLGGFLFSVWSMLLFFMATVDEAFRQLSKTTAVIYLFAVVTSLALLYLFFSLSTLVYLGYPLFVLFAVWLIRYYCIRMRARYRCGRCGKPLHDKGVCPRCGAHNE